MPYLKRIGATSLVRIKYERKPWELASSGKDFASCQVSDKGVLRASTSSPGAQVEMCEWALFTPKRRLIAGWLIQRAHWFGDIQQASFLSNPIFTDNPFLRVQLSVPTTAKGSSAADSARLTNKLGLRMLTVRGPVDQNWRTAFER